MKRLGIFLIYDPEGKIDRYIPYMLEDINKFLEKLVIICNGVLSAEGRQVLEQYSDTIIVRKNIGFDFYAWKEAMFDYIGFSRVKEYDSLVLFNDSFFGPLDSFGPVFQEMDSRHLDFWGLTVHGEVDTVNNRCPYGFRPRYLQTYFLVFNKRLINDYAFYSYWNQIPIYKRFQDVGEKCSAVLTRYFSDMGFSWGAYSDTTDLETDRQTNICHHAFNTLELIAKRKYPIIKRKSFILGKTRFLRHHNGLDLSDAFSYIQNETSYDISMIYEHIIRRYDVSEIKESLNLDFIFSSDDTCSNPDLSAKTLVAASVFDASFVEKAFDLLSKLDSSIHVFVLTSQEIYKQIVNLIDNMGFTGNLNLQVSEETDHVSSLLQSIKENGSKYEFIAFLNDEIPLDETDYIVSKISYRESLWRNIIWSAGYVNRILDCFNNHPFLGLLVPPTPLFGHHYMISSMNNPDCTEELDYWKEQLGTELYLPQNKAPLSLGGCFWCRADALKTLSEATDMEQKHSDLQKMVLERLLPYIAKGNGYLTGWCMSEQYAASELEGLRDINKLYFYSFPAEIRETVIENEDGEVLESTLNRYCAQAYISNCRAYLNTHTVPDGQEQESVPAPEQEVVEIGVKKALSNYIHKHGRRIKNSLKGNKS